MDCSLDSKHILLADDKINLTKNLKLDLGRLENNVGKGENAVYQHFLLFPQCFQNACCKELFATQSRLLTTLRMNLYENIVQKGENACKQHIVLFP